MKTPPKFRYASDGISLETFAHRTGIRRGQLEHYCRIGRIEGAEFDRTIWQWRIYPPAKLVTGRQA